MTETYLFSQWLFLRLLGLCYLAAFWSLWRQVLPLYGEKGITPVVDYVHRLRGVRWAQKLRCSPSIFHIACTDRILQGATLVGMLCSVLLLFDQLTIPCLILCWLLYLSFSTVGDVFLSFQWDVLLVEVGCASVGYALLVPAPLPMQCVMWMILFKLMWSSGVIKVRSRCPCWADGSAMALHYETQPIPNRIAWYAHQQPAWAARLSTKLVIGWELYLPLLLWAPQPVSMWAAAAIAVLMLLIIATGNYAFFNLLTICLCVPFVPDSVWGIQLHPPPESGPLTWVLEAVVSVFACWLLVLNVRQLFRLFGRTSGLERIPPRRDYWGICGGYGLFARMTTVRNELVIEGSDDGEQWHAYRLPYQPQLLDRPPRQIAPYQPRLDWQMWFAALGTIYTNQWLMNLMDALKQGNPQVLSLFEFVPFRDHPPKYLRVVQYRYHFTNWRQSRATGNWWQRGEPTVYWRY